MKNGQKLTKNSDKTANLPGFRNHEKKMEQMFDSKTIYLWSVERKNVSDEHSRKHKEDMALVKQHVNYESDGRGSAD